MSSALSPSSAGRLSGSDIVGQIMPRGLKRTLSELLTRAVLAVDHDRTIARDLIVYAASLLGERRTLLSAQAAGATINPGGLAAWQEKRVVAYMAQHLAIQMKNDDLAKTVNLSSSHFCRAFKQSAGLTPHAFIVRMRIERAQDMMLNSGAPLSQIALDCGFADQSHLSRQFRRVVGQSPMTWRRTVTIAPLPQATSSALGFGLDA